MMNLNDLLKRLNKFNCEARVSNGIIGITSFNYVTEEVEMVFSIDQYADFMSQGIKHNLNLMEMNEIVKIGSLINEYLKTPANERIPKKGFFLKSVNPLVEDLGYLCLTINTGKYIYSSKRDTNNYKTIFTQDEIDNMDTSGLIPETAEL